MSPCRVLALAGLTVIILSGGFLLLQPADDFPQAWRVIPFDMGWSLFPLLLGLIVFAIATLVALTATWWTSPWDSPIFAALCATAPVIPGIAAAVTSVGYLALLELSQSYPAGIAIFIGIGTALYTWLLLALLYRRFVSVECANPRIYRELCGRLDELDAQLEVLKPASAASISKQSAYSDACAHREFIAGALGRNRECHRTDTGFHWISATGYVDLWNRLHRAEEALVQLEPVETVVSGAHYDKWSIQGSDMENRSALGEKLESALKTLSDARTSENTPDQVAETGQAPEVRQEEARAILREVKRSLNEYRDNRWEGLVRARNRLVKTGTFTSLFGYMFFSLAIVAGAGKETIIAAAAFYLVGASVGLFNQLLAEANTECAIEDYGLATARLIHIPLFSGLAALGGVVLMALLPTALTLAVPTPQTALNAASAAQSGSVASGNQGSPVEPDTRTATPRSTTPDPGMVGKLRDIFDLERYPFGLVIAAVFGLTPRLLIDRLKSQTDRYTQELQTTQATGGAKGGAG